MQHFIELNKNQKSELNKMSEAKIAILLQGEKIVVKSQLKSLSQAELSLLIMHLGLLKDDLKNLFKKGIKKIEE